MKARKPVAMKVLGLGVLGLGTFQTSHAETQITFGGFSVDSTDISSIAGYGDNVSANNVDYTVSAGALGVIGTPNIDLTWAPGFQTYTAWDGRGNVAQLDFNGLTPSEITLTLTPSGGSGVLVRSFDLDEWAGSGGDTLLNWAVTDPVGTLASGTWTQTDAGGRNTINTGLGVGDVRPGQPVTLRLTLNTGAPSYIALDNLTFDQVPEPSTMAVSLLGLGLGAAAMRRRRRK